VRFAWRNKSGDTVRPAHPISGALFDVSAKCVDLHRSPCRSFRPHCMVYVPYCLWTVSLSVYTYKIRKRYNGADVRLVTTFQDNRLAAGTEAMFQEVLRSAIRWHTACKPHPSHHRPRSMLQAAHNSLHSSTPAAAVPGSAGTCAGWRGTAAACLCYPCVRKRRHRTQPRQPAARYIR
jgi:hypothetical protein